MYISKLEGKRKVPICFQGEIGREDPRLEATNALWFHAVRILSVWLHVGSCRAFIANVSNANDLRAVEGIRKDWALGAFYSQSRLASQARGEPLHM